jgi:hypothetical protein
MDSTFMTIHNLSSDANILFASDSILDILGYQPRDVEGRSCFDYFHPEEVPLARYVHGRGVLMDRAAALHYTRIRNVHGQWIGCECTFSVVHDILVACTSIYHQDEKSQKRAQDTPQVRRMFSSPQDPRFHMLGHLAPKFTMAPPDRELRAALIINRFTRSLAIMFATNSVAEVLGLEPAALQNKSFYECIDDNCLDDAMECIEAAKANDSIAYLRFWSRDARREDELSDQGSDADENLSGDTLAGSSSGPGEGVSGSTSTHQDSVSRRDSSDSEQGGVRLDAGMDLDSPRHSASPIKREPLSQEPEGARIYSEGPISTATTSNQESAAQSSASDSGHAGRGAVRNGRSQSRRNRTQYPMPSVEMEAFVSCTSDGLVVIIRRARELPSQGTSSSAAGTSRQGIFAAPWAPEPVAAHYGPATSREPHLQQPPPQQLPESAVQEVRSTGGPPMDQLMASIQEVAVFAWALVGINRNLSSYSHGNPTGDAQPREDQYSSEQSSGSELPAYAPPAYSDQNHVKTWGAPGEDSANGFVGSEKGQPIEPRYTSYPEQGANQLRSNGPWSNGNAGSWRSLAHTQEGQSTQFNGHTAGRQAGGHVNDTPWNHQDTNGNYDGSGHHSAY